MSTILNTNGTELSVPLLSDGVNGKFYVITAEWNKEITHALRDGALETLRKGMVKESDIVSVGVPGTVELVNAAAMVLEGGEAAGIIVIGCVIRGDTPHFDYVCQSAAQGISILNAKGKAPVIFGVLTTNNYEQAQDRAGGRLGNKGSEAAVAVIEMANLHRELNFRKLP